MSLVKLASIIVVNKPADPNSGSSKTFSPRNFAAAAIGGTTGFASKEAVEEHMPQLSKHLPKFDKTKLSHRYASRMGSVLGGFAGAATTYKLMHNDKNNQEPKFYMY